MSSNIQQVIKAQYKVTEMLGDFKDTEVGVTQIQDELFVTVRVFDKDIDGLYTRLVRTGLPAEIDGVTIEVLQNFFPTKDSQVLAG